MLDSSTSQDPSPQPVEPRTLAAPKSQMGAFDVLGDHPVGGEPPKDPLDDHLATWRSKPTPTNMGAVVNGLQSTIDRAVRNYTRSESPIVRSKARVLAARAVKGYDPSFGASLPTHVYRQLQALQRLAPNLQEPLAIPEKLRRDRGGVLRAIEELTNTLDREPSDEEVSEHAGLSVKRVLRVRSSLRAGVPASRFEDAESEDGEDGEGTYDAVASASTPEQDWVDAVYHDSGDIDRIILQYRTGYRGAPVLPNQDIAKRLKISPAAVSQRAARLQARLDEFYR